MRLSSLALALATLAQQDFGGRQQSLLMARQAYLFDRRSGGLVRNQVDAALRAVLGGSPLAPILRGHKGAVQALAFSPDRALLASGGEDGTVRLWNARGLDVVSVALRGGSTVPRVLPGHVDGVQSLAFSPDGRRLAVLSGDGTLSLYHAQASEPSRVAVGEPGSFAKTVYDHYVWDPTWVSERWYSSVAFSPDGQNLAVANATGEISLWDLREENRPVLARRGPRGRSMRFSPDGHSLFAWDSNRVSTWDLTQPGASCTELNGDSYGIASVFHDREASYKFATTLSPDGQLMAIASRERGTGSVFLWDLRQPGAPGRVTREFREHTCILVFSGDGRRLAFGGRDGLWIWDVRESEENESSLASWGRPGGGGSTALALSHEGEVVAWGQDDGTVALWHFTELDSTSLIVDEGRATVRDLAWSPDGGTLAWSDGDASLCLHDFGDPTARTTRLDIRPYRGKAADADRSWSQDQVTRKLAYFKWMQAGRSQGRDEEFWQAGEREVHRVFAEQCLRFGPDGRLYQIFVTGDKQLSALIWEWRTPARTPEVVRGPHPLEPHNVLAVALGLAGEVLAAANGSNGSLDVWDLRHPTSPAKVLRDPSSRSPSSTYVFSLARFSPDGRTLCAQAGGIYQPQDARYWSGGPVLRWDLGQGVPAERGLEHPGGDCASMAYSDDSAALAAGLAVYPSPGNDPQRVQTYVAVWDLHDPPADIVVEEGRSLSRRHELHGHLGDVRAIAFSPEGSVLASGSGDRTVRLWELGQPQPAFIILRGHEAGVTALAFHPDGNTLASGGEDRTVRLWAAKTSVLADIVCERVWANFTADQWRQLVGGDIPYERTCPELPSGRDAPQDTPAADKVSDTNGTRKVTSQ